MMIYTIKNIITDKSIYYWGGKKVNKKKSVFMITILLLSIFLIGCNEQNIVNFSGIQIHSWKIIENKDNYEGSEINLAVDVSVNRKNGAYFYLVTPNGTSYGLPEFVREGETTTIYLPLGSSIDTVFQSGVYKIMAFDKYYMYDNNPQPVFTKKIQFKGAKPVLKDWVIKKWDYRQYNTYGDMYSPSYPKGYYIKEMQIFLSNNGDLPFKPNIFLNVNNTMTELIFYEFVFPRETIISNFTNCLNGLDLKSYLIDLEIDYGKSISIEKEVFPCDNVDFVLKSWNVVDYNNYPCININFEISDAAGIHLIDPDDKIIDTLRIDKEDTNCYLYLNGNKRPYSYGTYYPDGECQTPQSGIYQIEVGTFTKNFTFIGPDIIIKKCVPNWKEECWFGTCTKYLDSVEFTVVNSGDLPSYFEVVMIDFDNKNVRRCQKGVLVPNTENIYTVGTYGLFFNEFCGYEGSTNSIYLKASPGEHTLKIELRHYTAYKKYEIISNFSITVRT